MASITTSSSALCSAASSFRAESLDSVQRTQRATLLGNGTAPNRKSVKSAAVRCDASEPSASPLVLPRRQALLAAGMAATTPLWLPLVASSDAALAADIVQRGQRSVYLKAVKESLFNAVNTRPELVPDLLRLALNDAATYDKSTKTGGANGSIRFSAELSRPENKGLQAALELLEGVKGEVDAGAGEKGGAITYADLIQFGAAAAVKNTFLAAAISKAGGDEDKGRKLYLAIGSAGQWGFFDRQLGRSDAESADSAGRVVDWDSLSAGETKERLGALGVRPLKVPTLAIFLGRDIETVFDKLEQDDEMRSAVNKYRRSRKTVSENDYEVDLIATFTALSKLGAEINTEAYTYVPPRPKFKL